MGRRHALTLIGLIAAAALCACPAGAGAATSGMAYGGQVRATGKLVVTFSGGGVTSGTITWTPPSTGFLQVLSGESGGRKLLRGSLGLTGYGPTKASVQYAASGTCTDTEGFGDDVQLPVIAVGSGRLRFAWLARHITSLFQGPLDTPLALAFAYTALGPQPDEPAPTHCGGPLPGDFLGLLPARSVSLRRLLAGPTPVDLSGTARFSAAGMTGTVTSTVAIHTGRLRGVAVPQRQPSVPRSQEDAALYVHYRVTRVSGTIGVRFGDVAASCAPLDACGLSGSERLRLGPGRGSAEVIAYAPGSTNAAVLRRSVGLAPGRGGGAQVGGLGSWTGSAATISETVQRGGRIACQDSSRLPVAGLEINVTGTRAAIRFGATGGLQLVTPNRDLLRTRCPGPAMSDLIEGALAHGDFPARWLGRRTLTLHLTHGANLRPLGFGPPLAFTWHTQANLTIVLQRTAVTEKLVPSSAFET